MLRRIGNRTAAGLAVGLAVGLAIGLVAGLLLGARSASPAASIRDIASWARLQAEDDFATGRARFIAIGEGQADDPAGVDCRGRRIPVRAMQPTANQHTPVLIHAYAYDVRLAMLALGLDEAAARTWAEAQDFNLDQVPAGLRR